MKYTIEFGLRGGGLQLIPIDDDLKEKLVNEEIDPDADFWDIPYNEDLDCDVEFGTMWFNADTVNRWYFDVMDENNNIVFKLDEDEAAEFINDHDMTYRDEYEDTVHIPGWEHEESIPDGNYITRWQTLKNMSAVGEFETDEPFDPEKLYLVGATWNEEYFEFTTAWCYQQGETRNYETDMVELDDQCTDEEQYWDTGINTWKDGVCMKCEDEELYDLGWY